jgi:hypothetical protein
VDLAPLGVSRASVIIVLSPGSFTNPPEVAKRGLEFLDFIAEVVRLRKKR